MGRFVPYLADEAIERNAASLIGEFERARGVTIEPPIPVEDIVEKYLKLRIEFDDMHARHNAPRPPNGQPDILGAIYGDGSIFIDESLDPEENPSREGRYRFTLAHEVGHYRYHQDLLAEEAVVVTADAETGEPTLRGDGGDQNLKRAEWQANRFASCLLVPLPLLALEWFNWMKSFRPFLFEDFARDPRWWAPSRRRDAELFRDRIVRPNRNVHDYAFDKVASQLAPIFDVSTQAMRIRLETVGLLSTGNEVSLTEPKFSALALDAYTDAAKARVAAHGKIIWR